jgi:hypothetical protein
MADMKDSTCNLEARRETRRTPHQPQPKQIEGGGLTVIVGQHDDDDDDDDVIRASAVALAVVAAQTPDDVRRGIACSDSSQAKIVETWKREHQWQQQQQQQETSPQQSTTSTTGKSLWSSVVDQYTSTNTNTNTTCSLQDASSSLPRNQDGTNKRMVVHPSITSNHHPSPIETEMATTLQQQLTEDDKDVKTAIRMALAVASNPNNLAPQEIRRRVIANHDDDDDDDDDVPTINNHNHNNGKNNESNNNRNNNNNNNNNHMSFPEEKKTAPNTIILDNYYSTTTANSTTTGDTIAKHQHQHQHQQRMTTHHFGESSSSSSWTLQGRGIGIVWVVINFALLDCYITSSFWRTMAIVNVTFLICLLTNPNTNPKKAAQVEARATPSFLSENINRSMGSASTVIVNHEKAKDDASIPMLVTSSKDKYAERNGNDDIVKTLGEWQPDATEQECRRFLKAREGDVDGASTQLGSYLSWRASLWRMGVDDRSITMANNDKNDENDSWQRACYGAIKKTTDPTATISSIPKLPCLVHFYRSTTNDTGGDDKNNKQGRNDRMLSPNGTRIIHVLPAQLDPRLASPATYALAVAIYLDLTLDRRLMEKITVVLDVRAGTGWANPSPISLLPFIKIVAGLLNNYFPERLSRLVLFPLPRAATFLFNTAKTFLDQDTAGKMEICPGPGNHDSPVPEQVGLFFNEYVIQTMEKRRLSLFVGG